MALTATYSALLKEFMPIEMIYEELAKRNYVLSKIKKNPNWRGGQLDVPFIQNMGSSFAYAAYPTAADIHEFGYQKGYVSAPKEILASLKFNEKDLDQDDLKGSFLKIMPDQIEMFIDFFKEVISMALLNGPHFAKLTVNGAADGTVVVDRIERFQIGQHVWIDDDDSPAADGYVQTININTKTITLDTTRAGGVDLNCSAFTTAQNAKIYIQGADTAANAFTSMHDVLLSAANGGPANIYNKTKASYPFLQAVNVDGSGVTKTNLLEKVFDGLTAVRQIGKGNASDVLMSYKHLGTAMKILEVSRDYTILDKKPSVYGWSEIVVAGVTGQVTLAGIPEMDDSEIYYIDWKGWTLFSNKFIERRKSPSGDEWYEERNTTGYTYILDHKFYGEQVCSNVSANGVLYGISYS